MLFHEIYGRYFQTVGEILRKATDTGVTERDIRRIVAEMAFSESGMVIPDALKSSKWPFLKSLGKTVLRYDPAMPLTVLEKRWLKSLLRDPRIRLFDVSEEGLEDVESLFAPEVFVWFDAYSDGDPYEDPVYIQTFRTLLSALEQQRFVELEYTAAKGKSRRAVCIPIHLEYSPKDDKFRVQVIESDELRVLNVARIRSCSVGKAVDQFPNVPEPQMEKVVLELVDERNTLERAMLHFSHLKKEAVRLEGNRYRLTMWYQKEDETEILIRILSFGPQILVMESESLLEQIRKRLQKQENLRTL